MTTTDVCDVETVRVVVVDDHPMLLEGTRSVLQQQNAIAVVGLCGTGCEAIRLAQTLQPDVLLLDMQLPDMSGLDVARHVRNLAPGVAVVGLTGHDDPEYPRALRRLGGRGFLRKSATATEIADTVRTAAAGGMRFAPDVESRSPKNVANLTRREHEVLTLLAAGRRNSEIAEAMVVSPKTVEFHVSRLLDKLGARSRLEAVSMARSANILT